MPLAERAAGLADTHPAQTDVVIIGGGIVGVFAAYYLARRNVSVAVLEKGVIGGEQSSRNWGWLRQQNRPELELPLAKLSLSEWAAAEAEIGETIGFVRGGTLFVTESQAELAQWEAWFKIAVQHGLDSRMLSSTQARALAKGTDRPWIGGLFTPSDGRAEPMLAAPAIARAAARHGAAIHQNCAVRGIHIEAGRAVGVITEKGLIRAKAVLCAGGVWSTLLARRHGIRLPQVGIRTSALRTSALDGVLDSQMMTSHFSVRKRLDGGFTIGLRSRGTIDLTVDSFRYARQFFPGYLPMRKKLGVKFGRPFWDSLQRERTWAMDGVSPFEVTRILDPEPNPKVLNEALESARAAFPALRGAQVLESWGGVLDFTPDQLPVISEVASLPGFYFATGCSGHGFGIASGIGLAAANLVTGEPAAFDMAPFRFSRMNDGTRLVPHGL